MDEESSLEYSLQDISSWTPEKVLEALTYEFEPYANSVRDGQWCYQRDIQKKR